MNSEACIYKAVEKLNKIKNCKLVVKEIKEIDTYYEVFIIDNEMKEKMDKARLSFHYLDYVPEFKALVTKIFFTDNSLSNYDGSIGINKPISKDSKIILRVAFWILGEWERWKSNVLKNHEELK